MNSNTNLQAHRSRFLKTNSIWKLCWRIPFSIWGKLAGKRESHFCEIPFSREKLAEFLGSRIAQNPISAKSHLVKNILYFGSISLWEYFVILLHLMGLNIFTHAAGYLRCKIPLWEYNLIFFRACVSYFRWKIPLWELYIWNFFAPAAGYFQHHKIKINTIFWMTFGRFFDVFGIWRLESEVIETGGAGRPDPKKKHFVLQYATEPQRLLAQFWSAR